MIQSQIFSETVILFIAKLRPAAYVSLQLANANNMNAVQKINGRGTDRWKKGRWEREETDWNGQSELFECRTVSQPFPTHNVVYKTIP